VSYIKKASYSSAASIEKTDINPNKKENPKGNICPLGSRLYHKSISAICYLML